MNTSNQPSHLRKVSNEPHATEHSSGDGGDGGGTDARLREIDARLREVEKDVVEIKTRLEPLATREDIERMKSEMLKWGIGILVTTVTAISGMVVLALKLFSQPLS